MRFSMGAALASFPFSTITRADSLPWNNLKCVPQAPEEGRPGTKPRPASVCRGSQRMEERDQTERMRNRGEETTVKRKQQKAREMERETS